MSMNDLNLEGVPPRVRTAMALIEYCRAVSLGECFCNERRELTAREERVLRAALTTVTLYFTGESDFSDAAAASAGAGAENRAGPTGLPPGGPDSSSPPNGPAA